VVVFSIREHLRSLNGNGVVTIDAMDDVVAAMKAPWHANLMLFGMFAGLTVLLACLGLYGMLTYAVVLQRRDIGVRLVLGATPLGIAREVLATGARTVAVGAIIGAAFAVALTPLMKSILFNVAQFDPFTLLVAPVGFAAVALVACAVPALRAARTDPAICLRAE